MKKIRNYLLLLLYILHGWMLFYYGIAAPTTTLLWYVLIYFSVKKLIPRLCNAGKVAVVRFQWTLFCGLLLTLEYILLWLLPVVNQSEEHKYSLYFSGYQRDRQIQLVNTFSSIPRMSGWEQGYRPYSQQEYITDEFRYTAHYDSMGFRNPAHLYDTGIQGDMLLVLGDSFAEGFGAPDDSTFPVSLARHLSNSHILNAGICGSNPLMAIRLYRNKLQQMPVKQVLLVINLTDVKDIEYTLHAGVMPFSEYLMAVSRIYRFINAGIFNNQMDLLDANPRIARRRMDNARQLTDSLQNFQQQLRQNDISLTLVYLPLKEEISDTAYRICKDWLEAPLQQSGIPLISLTSLYKDNMNGQTHRWYWPNDGHHTPLGYDLMAQIVAAEWRKMHPMSHHNSVVKLLP